PRDQEGQGGTSGGADGAPGKREQSHLREINHEDAAAAGAQSLHGSNSVAPAVEMAFDRIADADAADEKRGQANNGEKLGKPLNVAFEPGRRVAPAADIPAGFRQLRARLSRNGPCLVV